jgi:hypothetical protein
VNELCDSSELQSALLLKSLLEPGDKVNIGLMCVVPQMLTILSYAENIRNFVSSSVWKCIDFSMSIHGSRFIMFYFIAI